MCQQGFLWDMKSYKCISSHGRVSSQNPWDNSEKGGKGGECILPENKTSHEAGVIMRVGLWPWGCSLQYDESPQTQAGVGACTCGQNCYRWMGKGRHFSQRHRENWIGKIIRSWPHLTLPNIKCQLEITTVEYLYDFGAGKDFLNKTRKEQIKEEIEPWRVLYNTS